MAPQSPQAEPTLADAGEIELSGLAPALHKYVQADAPTATRLLAARGLVPLAPRDNILLLAAVIHAGPAEHATIAAQTLEKMPERLLAGALDAPGTPLPAWALGRLVAPLAAREALLERLIVNRQTPDEALAAVAPQASARLVEMLAQDQQRCLRSAALVHSLRQHAQILRSSVERLFDFLSRAGVFYPNMPEFAEALLRLSSAELTEAAAGIVLPAEADQLLVEQASPPAADAHHALEPAPDAAAPTTEAPRRSILQIINALNVAQKVALATKGNREARSILIRESNRVVAAAAIKNPRISEQELVAAAKSRNISDEVLRIISNSREMTRSYAVKLALAQNPKTPAPLALRFLSTLRQNDIRTIAKSKNVSAALAQQAAKLASAKS